MTPQTPAFVGLQTPALSSGGFHAPKDIRFFLGANAAPSRGLQPFSGGKCATLETTFLPITNLVPEMNKRLERQHSPLVRLAALGLRASSGAFI